MTLRLAALPLFALVLTALNVSAATAQAPADGPCYSARPLPALPAGTRVFVRPTLILHRDRSGARSTSGETSQWATSQTDSGVVMRYTDSKGYTATVRPSASICAYPPDAALPAYLNGVTPDLIIP